MDTSGGKGNKVGAIFAAQRLLQIAFIMFVDVKKNLLYLYMALLGSPLFAQETSVTGIVYDGDSDVPLPFAKVFFIGTQAGTTTDTSGYFSLDIQDKQIKKDSIMVSYLGYISQEIAVQRGQKQEIIVRLYSTLFSEFEEVVAVAGENVAWRYLRKVIENKDRNNPDQYDYYRVEQYAKIRFDLNNFTDKTKKNIVLRPFDYIWDNAQETEDGVNYLPMLITEKHSTHYHRKSPYEDRTIVSGEKTTGLAGPKLLKFTGDLYVTPNIYENFVTILDKSFPSPLNDNYRQNYKFYLEDSIYTDEGVTYHIRFLPKHQRELGFVGDMYIDSGSYAIKEIHLRFDVMSNVNFVRSYYISQFYSEVAEGRWMLTESQVLGDFTILENASDLTGFFGRKKALFSNYSINEPLEESLFKGIEPEIYQDSAKMRTDAYWERFRADSLSTEEQKLYEVTARVQDDPAFKIRKNLILTFATGYIPTKVIQPGNLYSFYSYNPVERSRIKLGFRSVPENKLRLDFSVFGAYGTYDSIWKYGGSLAWNASPKGISRIGASYRCDIDQLGRSFNQIELDHVLSSLAQIGSSNSRNYVTDFKAYFEQQIVTGTLLRAEYFYRDYSPVAGNVYMRFEDNLPAIAPNYRWSGLAFTFKFSHLYAKVSGEFYDKKDFYKSYRKYPDIALRYEYADKATFGSDFDVQKIKLSVRQKVNAKKLGHFTYTVEGGKTIGTVPHVALDIPFGNQLVLADDYSMNLMRFMEYAADQYVMAQFTHHFDGLILDRVPLINKLKWRELVFGKTFIGSLSDANKQKTYLFPAGMGAINRPYYEVGFGIENIFKFARIDFVWRLSPGMGEYYWFIVKPSFKFSF